MARWSETIAEVKHLAQISTQMPIGGIVLITLLDGRAIEGVLRRENLGNNAGEGGWRYYGECEIETKDRRRLVIDFLDIKTVTSAWTESTAAEYERLGLISIVK